MTSLNSLKHLEEYLNNWNVQDPFYTLSNAHILRNARILDLNKWIKYEFLYLPRKFKHKHMCLHAGAWMHARTHTQTHTMHLEVLKHGIEIYKISSATHTL